MKTLITLIILSCFSLQAQQVTPGVAQDVLDHGAKQLKHIAKFKAAVALFKIYDQSTEENTKERERNFVRAYAAFSLLGSEWKVIDKSRRLEVLLDKGVQQNLQNKDAAFPPINTIKAMNAFLRDTYPEIDGFSALSITEEIPTLHAEVKGQVQRLALVK